MANHCQYCHTHAPPETGGFEIIRPAPSCPGCPECERLQRLRKEAAQDWAETDTAIRDLVRPILGVEETDGDTYGVPAIEDIVGKLCAHLALAERLCRAVARCEQGRGRFSTAPLHDARCHRERVINLDAVSTYDAPYTCGGSEYQEALAAWEKANG